MFLSAAPDREITANLLGLAELGRICDMWLFMEGSADVAAELGLGATLGGDVVSGTL